MGRRLPIRPEAVLGNALDEAVEVGALRYEEGVLTEKEKATQMDWLVDHLLAALWRHGYYVQLVDPRRTAEVVRRTAEVVQLELVRNEKNGRRSGQP
jgi:hypothetical protein